MVLYPGYYTLLFVVLVGAAYFSALAHWLYIAT